jgi:methyl-accepting chemotaxis protein
MLSRMKELEEKVASMTTSTTTMVGKIADLREEVVDLSGRVHQRMEDVTEKTDNIEAELKKTSKKTDKIGRKLNQVVTEVDMKLNTNLAQIFERLKAAEAVSNDIRTTMETMEKAYKEMKSGDKMTGQTRSGASIYLAGIDKLKQNGGPSRGH